jgi:hypothetical protein
MAVAPGPAPPTIEKLKPDSACQIMVLLIVE